MDGHYIFGKHIHAGPKLKSEPGPDGGANDGNRELFRVGRVDATS